jgi:hypothetical protein
VLVFFAPFEFEPRGRLRCDGASESILPATIPIPVEDPMKTLRTITWVILTSATLAIAVQGQPAAPSDASTKPAIAPQPITPALPSASADASAADSLLVLVEIRDPASIRGDLEAALHARTSAEERESRAKRLQIRSKTYVELQKHHIESIKVRLDLAKKEKDTLEAQGLEAQKKRAELEMSLLRQREALRGREIDAARAQRELAEVAAKVSELELSLAVRRGEMMQLSGQALSSSLAAQSDRLRKDIRELEEKVLRAQVEEASKRESVAKQDGQVAKQRMKVFEAQAKLSPMG